MRVRYERLEASCLGLHEATRDPSTMSRRSADLAREGLWRENLLGYLIQGSVATEMVPCIPVSL